MSSQSSSSGLPIPPQLQGGAEVYNMIMGKIEPDLTSDMIDTLDEKYAGETEEEKVERMKKYAAAFIEYQKQFEAYMNDKKAEVKSFGRGLNQSIETDSTNKEASILDDLESQFSSSS
ncbi:MAG: hypothetical protein HOG89_03810 [Candidatus Peribacter sp.]|jgi:hypothetical protein|nr:hypothetical protein [Candidatus Peribacter sp.]MBT4393094.1 hypothetical protein [Candidatus Peribacter sp.]MBT4600893.1 hypothetical protein [Candidatus Peribacter sp.]MBT5638344.1 hypothetical protein [Candidatus Peribacter sp.]MBT5937905.1 hypothetical protein [Candidatus Peribacter sp.]